MKSDQRGGIVSFVVVGVVLAVLLLGALYASKQYARNVRDGGNSDQVAQDPNAGAANQTQPKSEDKPSSESTQGSRNSSSASESGQSSTPSASGSTDSSRQSPSTESTAPTSSGRIANSGPSDIPATGPSEVFALTAGAGFMVFAAYQYLLSRQHYRHSVLTKR